MDVWLNLCVTPFNANPAICKYQARREAGVTRSRPACATHNSQRLISEVILVTITPVFWGQKNWHDVVTISAFKICYHLYLVIASPIFSYLVFSSSIRQTDHRTHGVLPCCVFERNCYPSSALMLGQGLKEMTENAC